MSAFWPGFTWRVLAHEREKANSRGAHTGVSYDVRCGDRWLPPADAATGQHQHLAPDGGAFAFDELCIDDWFHLEQMGDRNWWLGVGNGGDYWHVNVHIDRDGQAHVSVEKQ